MVRGRVTVTKNFKGMAPVNLFEEFSRIGQSNRLPNNLAKAFHTLLLENIYENKYGFELSAFWSRLKKVKGWDERPFIAEGHYIENISIFTRDGHLTVGFKANARHPRGRGLTYAQIALLLEFGRLDKNLVARPLWRYTIKDFFARMDKDMKVEIKKLIQNARV